MNPEDFRRIEQDRLIRCEFVLQPKGEEYSRGGDRLHNFKDAAELLNCTPEQACLGMGVKHFVSIRDMIKDLEKGILPEQKQIDEKFTDFHNYLLLAEALIIERRGAIR